MSLLQTEKPNRRSLPNFYAGKQKQSVFFSFLFTHHAQKHARPESAPQGRRWIVRKSSSRLLLRTESRSPGQDEGFGGGGGRGGGGNAVQKLFLAFERLRNFFLFHGVSRQVRRGLFTRGASSLLVLRESHSRQSFTSDKKRTREKEREREWESLGFQVEKTRREGKKVLW